MVFVVSETTYASSHLHYLQIDIHMMYVWVVRKYGNQMGEICTVCWVRNKLEFVLKLFQWSQLCQVKHHHDAKQLIWQLSSVFTVNSRFQLIIKYSTVLCTIVVALEDGPIKIKKKQCQYHFAGGGHTSEFLVPVSIVCFNVCLQVHSD
jgi:hypothetical protein